jgi:hypothetical protein
MKNIIGLALFSLGSLLSRWGMELITDKKIREKILDDIKKGLEE